MVTLGPRAGKWLAAAFTASLAVNVFLAGLFVGQKMTAPLPPPGFAFRAAERPGDRPMPAILDRVADSLPPEQRTTFLGVIAKHQSNIATAGAAVREARAKVRDLMASEQFNRGATEAAMSDLRDRQIAFQRTLQAAFVDAAEALPPEARRQMVSAGTRRAANRE